MARTTDRSARIEVCDGKGTSGREVRKQSRREGCSQPTPPSQHLEPHGQQDLQPLDGGVEDRDYPLQQQGGCLTGSLVCPACGHRCSKFLLSDIGVSIYWYCHGGRCRCGNRWEADLQHYRALFLRAFQSWGFQSSPIFERAFDGGVSK